MAISLRAAGTATSGGNPASQAPAYPAGGQSGDLNILAVAIKPYNASISTPSGWTKIGEATDGTTAGGVNTGSMKIAVYAREGGFTGSVTLTITSGTDAVAVINTYQKAAGEAWIYSDYTSGAGASSSSYSATGAANVNGRAGDLIIASTANANYTISASDWAVGATGLSGGSTTLRQSAGGSYGNNCRLIVADRIFSSGTESAAPTFTFTNTESCSGETLFLRVAVSTAQSDGDSGSGTDAIGDRALTGADTASTTEQGAPDGIPKSDGDSASFVDGRSTVPYPSTWGPGDSTEATKLNREWRDTARWFVVSATGRPYFEAYNGNSSYKFVSGAVIPLVTEVRKVGFTHAASDTRVYSTECGMYQGYVHIGTSTAGATGLNSLKVSLLKNGVQLYQVTSPVETLGGWWGTNLPFTTPLVGGDYLEIALSGTWPGSTVGIVADNGLYPRLALWWRGYLA